MSTIIIFKQALQEQIDELSLYNGGGKERGKVWSEPLTAASTLEQVHKLAVSTVGQCAGNKIVEKDKAMMSTLKSLLDHLKLVGVDAQQRRLSMHA